MKLQTKKTKENIKIINILAIIASVVGLILCYLDFGFVRNVDKMIVIISLGILLFLSYLGAPFFRYDSEGETLIIQNDKALPFSLVKDTKSDFPKRKLVNFKINKYFYKKQLDIYITSKRVDSGKSKISFDISYLTARNIKDLNISLNKIIKENQTYLKKTEQVDKVFV